jgi:hypothetical protein
LVLLGKRDCTKGFVKKRGLHYNNIPTFLSGSSFAVPQTPGLFRLFWLKPNRLCRCHFFYLFCFLWEAFITPRPSYSYRIVFPSSAEQIDSKASPLHMGLLAPELFSSVVLVGPNKCPTASLSYSVQFPVGTQKGGTALNKPKTAAFHCPRAPSALDTHLSLSILPRISQTICHMTLTSALLISICALIRITS